MPLPCSKAVPRRPKSSVKASFIWRDSLHGRMNAAKLASMGLPIASRRGWVDTSNWRLSGCALGPWRRRLRCTWEGSSVSSRRPTATTGSRRWCAGTSKAGSVRWAGGISRLRPSTTTSRRSRLSPPGCTRRSWGSSRQESLPRVSRSFGCRLWSRGRSRRLRSAL